MAAKESRRRGRGVALVVVSLVIAVVVGAVRTLRRSPTPAATVVPHTPAPKAPLPKAPAPDAPFPMAPAPEALPDAPAATDEPHATDGPDAADDLTAIDGIGPKISAALVDAGITTYRVLADTSPDRLREVLAERGVRFAPTLDSWPEQARNRSA